MLLNRFKCPNCERELRSTAGVQVGRSVKCPHCKDAFTVAMPSSRVEDEAPDDEVPEEETRTRKQPSKRKAVTPAKAADEDDPPRSSRQSRDRDEPPRKKKGAGKKSSSLPIILGLVGVGVAILLVTGLGWWFMTRNSAPIPLRASPAPEEEKGTVINGVTYKTGLVRKVFPNEKFEGTPQTKIVEEISVGPMTADLPGDHFSIRYEGWLLAPKGDHKAYLFLREAHARLFFDNNQLMDGQTDRHGYNFQLTATGSPQPIRIEFRKGVGSSEMGFNYVVGSGPVQRFPKGWLVHDEKQAKGLGSPTTPTPGTDPNTANPPLPTVKSANQKAIDLNLQLLGGAFYSYNDSMNSFPASAITDKNGKALLSWRVAILPWIDDNSKLHKQFKLDEAWDSPHNIKLLEKMPKIYAPVGITTKEPHSTFLQLCTGPNTPWPTITTKPLPGSFPDGTSNTFLIVEAGEAVPWTKPVDMVIEPGKALPKFGAQCPDIFLATMADGSWRYFSRGLNEAMLRRLIDPADGQPIPLDTISKR